MLLFPNGHFSPNAPCWCLPAGAGVAGITFTVRSLNAVSTSANNKSSSSTKLHLARQQEALNWPPMQGSCSCQPASAALHPQAPCMHGLMQTAVQPHLLCSGQAWRAVDHDSTCCRPPYFKRSKSTDKALACMFVVCLFVRCCPQPVGGKQDCCSNL
jgi:hypothetical protein